MGAVMRKLGGGRFHAIAGLILLGGCSESVTAVTSPSHDCANAQSISINGQTGSYTITGNCEKVIVNGANIKLTIQSATVFELNGDQNNVAIGAVNSVRVRGSNNTVNYKQGPRSVSTSGDNNVVEPSR